MILIVLLCALCASVANTMARTFGQYEILAKLGQGGMGAVYKARHTPSGMLVALKVMTSGRLSRKDRQRFLLEARATARLRHRNIVTMHAVGEERGQPFLAMDFVEGRSLSDILDEGVPDERRAAVWMLKVASAMHHAHQQGLIHRDLKPANIMIDRSDEPIVMDFGIAKDVVTDLQLTATGAVIGTPNYMSPEQARGLDLDPRSDVFALGGILYALLTGETPFKAPSHAAVMLKVVEEEPTPPAILNPAVSPKLETICLKAMRKAPDDRYQSAEEMAGDLSAFLTESRISAKPESKIMKAARGIRGRKLPVAIGIAAVLVLAIVVGILIANLGADSEAPAPSARLASPATAKGPTEKPRGTAKAPPKPKPAEPPKPIAPKPKRPDPAVVRQLRDAGDMLARAEYDKAVALYQKLLAGSVTATQKQEAQQGLEAAQKLGAGAAKPEPSTRRPAATGRTVADGDRLLAACDFEEAAAAYEAAGADQARKDAARRLIALRRAAAGKLTGTRLPLTLANGARATLCRIGRRSAQLASAGGGVSPRDWASFGREDIVRIYQACFSKRAAEDHLNLGILCVVLGLREQAKREFDEAVRLSPFSKADAERFLGLRLAG